MGRLTLSAGSTSTPKLAECGMLHYGATPRCQRRCRNGSSNVANQSNSGLRQPAANRHSLATDQLHPCTLSPLCTAAKRGTTLLAVCMFCSVQGFQAVCVHCILHLSASVGECKWHFPAANTQVYWRIMGGRLIEQRAGSQNQRGERCEANI